MNKTIAIIGLGYVGLPLAVEFGKKRPVIGFDINEARVIELGSGRDHTLECSPEELAEAAHLTYSHQSDDLAKAQIYIVTVPTPVDQANRPDMTPLIRASQTVGKALKRGDIVIYESTVYPGATEEVCVPVLERVSGLKFNQDFFCGYSPERINPGDKEHRLPTIKKVTSGSTPAIADEVDALYAAIITAGTHKASSIKVAEAAKVIENTQRDLNISLMNELAIIFDRMGIDTQQVIEAAGTKWNFLKFYPGLVGGHCIGVDPYYLLHKSVQLGYEPQVILSGRRVNDGMPSWIAKRLVQLLIQNEKNPGQCKVLVLGITFKENVSDIRNSKVAALVHELQDYSINVHVVDPHASPNEIAHEYKLTLVDKISDGYDAIVVAVAHDEFRQYDSDFFRSVSANKPILMDLKGIYQNMDEDITCWRL